MVWFDQQFLKPGDGSLDYLRTDPSVVFNESSLEDQFKVIFGPTTTLYQKTVSTSAAKAAMAQARAMQNLEGVTRYNIRENNCTTTCARVLTAGATPIPNGGRSTTPAQLGAEFQRQGAIKRY